MANDSLLRGFRYPDGLHHFRKPEKKPRSNSRRSWLAWLWTTVLFLYASVMVALPLLLPVFAFHQPQGPYPVGTAVYHFIDNDRPDVLCRSDGSP